MRESHTIRIGDISVHSKLIWPASTPPDSPQSIVTATGTGQLGFQASSRRFKEEIKPTKASEGLFALEPVTLRYNKELDANGVERFGL